MKTVVLLIILLNPSSKSQALSVVEMPNMATCLAMKEAIGKEYATDVWHIPEISPSEVRCVEAARQ